MYQIFKNIDKQKQFETEGFVQTSLLSSNSIQELENLYMSYINKSDDLANSRYGMHISLSDTDEQPKVELIQKVQAILKKDLDVVFENYKVHLGGFLTKLQDDTSYTYPHQDWTFVDNNDTEAFSSTIWISLNDLNINSGSLGFIKGSHKIFDEVIGSPSPATYTSAQMNSSLFLDYLHVPDVKKGDALIFNNKTIHGAFPNRENKPRVAIAIGITPKNCDLYHYTLKPKDSKKFKKLKVDESFFIKYMNEELYEKYLQEYDFKEFDQNEDVEVQLTKIEKADLERKLIACGNKLNYFEEPKVEEILEDSQTENRSFFQIYTPLNIFREVKYRLGF